MIFDNARRLNGKVRSKALYWINRTLHNLECIFWDGGDRPLSSRPIFIIGPPRTGSTLLYQLMVVYFNLGYLTNFHCKYYGSPYLAEKLLHQGSSLDDWKGDFSSYYGGTEGKKAPSECGEYWYRFFRRRPQYVRNADVPLVNLRCLRGSVRAIGDVVEKPFIFKNLLCSLRLEPLFDTLPESLFIVVKRDLIDTASSLLRGRIQLFGDLDHWLSVEPPNITELRKLPPHEQVVEQVRGIYKLIDTNKKRIGPERFIEVAYKDLCKDTYATMIRIEDFLKVHGMHVDRRAEIPAEFDQSTKKTGIDSDLYRKMTRYVEEGHS